MVKDILDELKGALPVKEIKRLNKEVEHMKETGIPRCQHCKTNFIKVKEESGKYHSTWEPNCKCLKKKLRVSIG